MNGAYIILGGGMLIVLVLTYFVVRQMAQKGEFKDPKPKNHYLGAGIAIGMGFGLPVGLMIGIALENIALGISVGPALGSGIGVLFGSMLEKKYNPEPLLRSDKKEIGSRTLLGIFTGLGITVFTLLLVFALIS